MSVSIIRAHDVSRWYGKVLGVLEISFDLESGVSALLGPNGSGKTTLLRMLIGRIRPNRGSVRLFGEDPWSNRGVLARVGYSPEMAPLYPSVSARVFLQDLLRLNGYSYREARSRASEVLNTVGLADAADRSAGGYSKGMRQRLRLGQALAHEPDLLLLDEPLTGLDPMARGFIMDRIKDYGRSGKTVLVSSHVLHEVEEMTDNVLILHHGRLLASGTVYEIRELLEGRSMRVTITCSDPRRLLSHLAAQEDVIGVQLEDDGRSLTVETRGPDRFHERLIEDAAAAGVDLLGLRSPDETLESVFQALVSRSA